MRIVWYRMQYTVTLGALTYPSRMQDAVTMSAVTTTGYQVVRGDVISDYLSLH